ESEIAIARLQLMNGFFDGFQRELALSRLIEAQTYLLNAMRPLAAATTQFSQYGDTGIGILRGMERRISTLDSQIRLGYNPFGFHPEFVPFLSQSPIQTNHTDTVTSAVAFAQVLVTDALTYQDLE